MSAPFAETPDWPALRRTMVDCQIRTFDVTDQRLIARLLAVPRERFVPDALRDLAYSDVGLTIEGRYLLPPFILARLLQGARLLEADRVLDIGCGTGYSTALVAGLTTGGVVALESEAQLCRDLRARLDALDLAAVSVRQGPFAAGAPDDAPFDVILVNGAVETTLEPLFAQLAPGGRLVTIRRNKADPTGRAAKALCYEKRAGEIGSRYLFDASAPVLPGFREAPSFAF